MEDIRLLEFFPPSKLPNYTNIQGTQCNLREEERTSSMRLLIEWVDRLIMERYSYSTPDSGAQEFNSKGRTNIWFAKYNKGDYTKDHDHCPFAIFSFVYFLNCPKGSSPLVFSTSGKRIKAEEGKVIIFSSHVRHGVPPNKCENRITLAGNMGYDLNT